MFNSQQSTALSAENQTPVDYALVRETFIRLVILAARHPGTGYLPRLCAALAPCDNAVALANLRRIEAELAEVSHDNR